MSEFTDPLVAYILLGLLLVVGVVGAGFLIVEQAVAWIPVVVLMGVFGFFAGAYAAGNHTVEWSLLLVVAGIAAGLSFFTPVSLVHSVLITVAGYLFGARSPRH